MRLLLYVRGMIGLVKDAARLFFKLLARPHCVALLLAVVIGAFWLVGVEPRAIPSVVGEKWNAVVADRKKVWREDLQQLSDYIDAQRGTKTKKKQNVSPPVLFPVRRDDAEIVIRDDGTIATASNPPAFVAEPPRPTADYFISAVAPKADEPELNDHFIKGRLNIVGSSKVRINGMEFSLPVKIRSGRAGDAFGELKRRYDGSEGRCYPSADDSDIAECFVGAVGLGKTLIDFGYAENL